MRLKLFPEIQNHVAVTDNVTPPPLFAINTTLYEQASIQAIWITRMLIAKVNEHHTDDSIKTKIARSLISNPQLAGNCFYEFSKCKISCVIILPVYGIRRYGSQLLVSRVSDTSNFRNHYRLIQIQWGLWSSLIIVQYPTSPIEFATALQLTEYSEPSLGLILQRWSLSKTGCTVSYL